ncbi:MAG: putative Helicase [Candidatus Nitrospira kreftii]|uniref:Putative Helicase n=1 Tax=Candidatus Nitrospira kreftii TaxID=2652173 RepID=A0A7S8IWD3_9BACT|nr:MAG: putative Helicase [Candidatus Nitrospira kreftii]
MRKKSVSRPRERGRFPSDAKASSLAPAPGSAAVLTAFRALTVNDLHTMAPKETVLRGYDYFRQQRLQHYVWGKDGATLTALVQGTSLYEVIFSLDEGFLSSFCDCPAWDFDWLCKHVLCACFATKHLLSPETFPLSDQQQVHLAALRIELLGDLTETGSIKGTVPSRNGDGLPEAGYEIVIDAGQPYPQLVIHRNGVRIPAGWTPALPPELRPFLNPSWFSSEYGDEPLLRYLRVSKRRFPIVLKVGRESIALQWTPSVTCRSKTEIALAGHDVRIRAVCLADETALDRIVRFRSFVVDVTGRRLLCLENESGWDSFRALRHGFQGFNAYDHEVESAGRLRAVTLPDGQGHGRWQGIHHEVEFTVTRDEFQSTQIDLIQNQAHKTLGDLLLRIDGEEAPVHSSDSMSVGEEVSYALILAPLPDEVGAPTTAWILQAECRRSDTRFAPSASTFSFIRALEQGRAVSAPLRAQKRKAMLYDLFFTLLTVDEVKERDRRIKTVLDQTDWARSIRLEAAQWLSHHLSMYASQDVRLQVNERRWTLRAIDKHREALLYRIPFEVFGLDAFRGMPSYDVMKIAPLVLFQRLPDLLEKLTAAGITLLYEDKPLRPIQWDCTVQVGRQDRAGTGINWFEIRPEIRCDGVVIDETEWRQAVRQGGMIDTGHGLRVLDGQTMERLRAIIGLTGDATEDRKTAPVVRVPRLQILDWLALREQGIPVSLPAEDEAVLARLLGFEQIEKPPLPKALHAKVRPYQRDGYAWLAFLYEHRFGACLADDMGLGKTLQTICLLAAIKEGRIKTACEVKGPHLVVVPTSLLFNWEQELARFAPGLTVHVYSGSERKFDAGDGEVVLTTYGLARRDIDSLEQMAFHVIVFDEAQAVKNIRADTTGAVRRLKGRFKIALTGTPLENHLGEYFSVMDLCVPGLLGEYDRFKKDLKRIAGRALHQVLRRTRPFILRRTKAEILQDLPPKIEHEVFLELTDRQKALYKQTVDQVRSTIDDAYRTKTSGQAQLIALTAILKLRQICLSPRLLTNQANETSPKLGFLVERLHVLRDEGHSALVFSQFTSFLDLVQEACLRHGLLYHRLDGSTAPTARKARVTAFQTGEQPSVFLLSLKAGGQGLNLTRASYVFHLDPWWNPAVERQASDRAHRIGQRQTVSIVRILMRHSIEEKMVALKQRKLELYDAVMAGVVRGSGQGVLTKADFDFLLSPGA